MGRGWERLALAGELAGNLMQGRGPAPVGSRICLLRNLAASATNPPHQPSPPTQDPVTHVVCEAFQREELDGDSLYVLQGPAVAGLRCSLCFHNFRQVSTNALACCHAARIFCSFVLPRSAFLQGDSAFVTTDEHGRVDSHRVCHLASEKCCIITSRACGVHLYTPRAGDIESAPGWGALDSQVGRWAWAGGWAAGSCGRRSEYGRPPS